MVGATLFSGSRQNEFSGKKTSTRNICMVKTEGNGVGGYMMEAAWSEHAVGKHVRPGTDAVAGVAGVVFGCLLRRVVIGVSGRLFTIGLQGLHWRFVRT